jgi:hypothetical protein
MPERKLSEKEREEVVAQIREAVKAGRVEWPKGSEDVFPIMLDDRSAFQIIDDEGFVYVRLDYVWDEHRYKEYDDGRVYENFGGFIFGGFIIAWGLRGFGFGTVTFVKKAGGVVEIDSEMMGKKFCQKALSELFRHYKRKTKRFKFVHDWVLLAAQNTIPPTDDVDKMIVAFVESAKLRD